MLLTPAVAPSQCMHVAVCMSARGGGGAGGVEFYRLLETVRIYWNVFCACKSVRVTTVFFCVPVLSTKLDSLEKNAAQSRLTFDVRSA